MSQRLPSAAPRYDAHDQATTRQLIEQELTRMRSDLSDALLANGGGLLLRSPNGTHWLLTVDNTGTLQVNGHTPVPGR